MTVLHSLEDIMPGIMPLMLLDLITRRRNFVPKKRRIYQDPFDVYMEKEFKRRFRLTKDEVLRLHAKIALQLQYRDYRGRPLSSIQQLLIGLQYLGFTDLLRDTGDGLMVSIFSAWKCVERVVDAIMTLEAEFLYYPDAQQQQTTATYIFQRYGIRNVFMGFTERPIKIP